MSTASGFAVSRISTAATARVFPDKFPDMSLGIPADSLPKVVKLPRRYPWHTRHAWSAVSGVLDTPAGDINQPDPRRVATATRTSRGRYTTLSTPRCEYPAVYRLHSKSNPTSVGEIYRARTANGIERGVVRRWSAGTGTARRSISFYCVSHTDR